MPKKVYHDELRRLFVGYKRWDSRIEKRLAKLRISCNRDKTHVILVVNSDFGDRTVTVACTLSDRGHGDRNIISDIMRAKYSPNWRR